MVYSYINQRDKVIKYKRERWNVINKKKSSIYGLRNLIMHIEIFMINLLTLIYILK